MKAALRLRIDLPSLPAHGVGTTSWTGYKKSSRLCIFELDVCPGGAVRLTRRRPRLNTGRLSWRSTESQHGRAVTTEPKKTVPVFVELGMRGLTGGGR